MAEIVFKDESYQITGACFEVYKQLGSGFLEAVYHESLKIEFAIQGTPFESQKRLTLCYKGHDLGQNYIPDFLCYDRIIVELKAVKTLADEHRAQAHNYLKATGLRLALLVNFGHHPQVQWERIVN